MVVLFVVVPMDAMRKRNVIIGCVVAAVVVVLALTAFVVMIPRSPFLSGVTEHFSPGLVPSSSYVDNLTSNDPDLVRESLAFLHRRNDPAGVANALPLLHSTDDYVWLNAALYTGASGRQEAVPYLIKALRHTAWRADPDTIAALKALTGEDFGGDFAKWQAWWTSQHPDQAFDWTSWLGHQPRVPATRRHQQSDP